MEARKIVAQYRLTGWAEMVKERMASGQRVKEFCDEKHISISTYYNRQKKVREAACAALEERNTRGIYQTTNLHNETTINATAPQGWAQITEIEVAEENHLMIEIGGYCIKVSNKTDMNLLEKTCRVLRTIC